MKYTILTLLFLSFNSFANASFNNIAKPLYYPDNIVVSSKIKIIWPDLYNNIDKKSYIKIELINNLNKKSLFYIFRPIKYKPYYFVVEIPEMIAEGNYTYKIFYFRNGKQINKRYYHSYKYPIINSFDIDNKLKPPNSYLMNIDNQKLVLFLHNKRLNKLHNKYNSIFFISSGSASAIAGSAFYYLTNFGIITTIVSATAIVSGAIGLSAGIYYGIKYYNTDKKINSIITNK